MKTNWIPSRKVLSGGVAGVVSWAVLTGLGYFNVPIPLEMQVYLPALLTTLVSYLVPPAQQDIIRRLDDRLVAIAGKDPNSDVSPLVGQAAERSGRP